MRNIALLIPILLLLAAPRLAAQSSACLLAAGRDVAWADADSAMRLRDYRGFFFGETHTAGLEPRIKLDLIRHLHRRHGVRHLFMEAGRAHAWLMNRYLETGDTALLQASFYWRNNYRTFWPALYAYNRSLPPGDRLVVHGVDFERRDLFRVLLLLRPTGETPASLRPFFGRLEAAAPDTGLADFTPAFAAAFKAVRKAFALQRQELARYYGDNFATAAAIIDNDAPQQMKWRPRNRTMGAEMCRIIAESRIERFLGFFGGAHLNYDRPSSMVRQAAALPGFAGATVYVASLYQRPPAAASPAYLGLAGGRDNDGLFRRLLPPGCAVRLLKSDATGEGYISDRCDWLLLADEQ